MKLCYFTQFEMFLYVLVIIITRFGENNVLGPKNIDIYQFWGFARGLLGPPYIFCLLLIKMETVQEHDLY